MNKRLTRQEFLRAGGVTLAGVSVLGLAGCGGGGGGGGQGSGSKSITYWASNQAPTIQDDKQILSGVLSKFKSQDGVKSDLQVIGWPDLFNRITTAVSSGQGPDNLNIGNTWSPTFQKTGAFLPFDKSALDAVGGKDKFVQTAYQTSGYEEPYTSLPLYGLSYGLFYNKAMFKKAGIQGPPKNWEEFVAIGKKLTNPPKQWGLALEGASITENAHWPFILGKQHGGDLFDKNGKPTFDSPPIVQAVMQYVGFMSKDKIVAKQDAQYGSGTNSLSDFAKGKVAMVMWQKNATSNLESNGMKKSEYGVARIPVLEPLPPGGEPIMSHAAGINMSVFQNTKNKDAALKFVKFMTDKKMQVMLNQKFGSLPVTKEAAADPAFQDETTKVFQDIYANHSAPMPLVADEGQMETLVGGAVKTLFAKAATGKVTEKDVKKELTAANQKMAAGGGS